jgi:hypothetical protein
MKKRNMLQEEAGEKIGFAHRVVNNVLGKQARIKREVEEEEIEDE